MDDGDSIANPPAMLARRSHILIVVVRDYKYIRTIRSGPQNFEWEL